MKNFRRIFVIVQTAFNSFPNLRDFLAKNFLYVFILNRLEYDFFDWYYTFTSENFFGNEIKGYFVETWLKKNIFDQSSTHISKLLWRLFIYVFSVFFHISNLTFEYSWHFSLLLYVLQKMLNNDFVKTLSKICKIKFREHMFLHINCFFIHKKYRRSFLIFCLFFS